MDASRNEGEIKAHNQARVFMQDIQDWFKVLKNRSNMLTDSWSKEETKRQLKELSASIAQLSQTIDVFIEKCS